MFFDIDDSIKLVLKGTPQGDWTMTTAVQFDGDPESNWSGLIVYDPSQQPSRNWLCLWAGHTGTSVVMRGLSDNVLTPRKTKLFVNKQGAEVTMDKKGNNYTSSFRALGGNAWGEIGQVKINIPEPYRVGLVTRTMDGHKRSKLSFLNFEISSNEINLDEIFPVEPGNSLSTMWSQIKGQS